jgi:hypothetical protein
MMENHNTWLLTARSQGTPSLSALDPVLAADRLVSPARDRPARLGCAASPASRDRRDRRPPARTNAAADPSPLCHRPDPVNHRQRYLPPAPVFAPIEGRGDGEALVPMRRIGRRDSRGRDKVQVSGVHRSAAGPIHRTRQGDGAVDYHRRDPRLSVNPDRHSRGGQGLDPAFAFARRGPIRHQPDINPAFLGADQRLDHPRASRQPIGADQDFALGVVDGADRERLRSPPQEQSKQRRSPPRLLTRPARSAIARRGRALEQQGARKSYGV